MNSRKEIRDIIVKIEDTIPVHEWKINELHLWPLVRIQLYFQLIKYVEKVKPQNSTSKPKTKKSKIKILFLFLFNVVSLPFWKMQLKKKKICFFANDSHRVNFKDSRYNRFFDVLVEKNKWDNEYCYIEYDELDKNQKYQPQHIVQYFHQNYTYSKILRLKDKLLNSKKNIILTNYDGFIEKLSTIDLPKSTKSKYNLKEIKTLAESFWYSYQFFKWILNKITPEKTYILCYYGGEGNLAYTAACNALGIETIEMQHGPQTSEHLGYADWDPPKEDYLSLPQKYWCWDNLSYQTLYSWINNHVKYEVFIAGHPWLDYWKNKSDGNLKEQDFILYALQPIYVTYDQLFPPQLVSFIKNEKYKWYLRLHPRQLSEYEDIKNYLQSQGVWDFVDVKEATELPLPLLLLNCRCMITHFSGVVLEATQFKKPVIILNETGQRAFQEIIEQGKAIYIPYNSSKLADTLATKINSLQNDKEDI